MACIEAIASLCINMAYFATSTGAVYEATLATYIVLRITGYLCVSRLPSTITLPASVCLTTCMFCMRES